MASSAAAKKIVVCGGNGFLGSRICQHAVARGWDVTSISRSGDPDWASLQGTSSSGTPPPWARRVAWERADMLRPSTYAPLLAGADCVVHSMGILLEADYKRVVRGQESPLAFAQRAFSSARAASRPPTQKASKKSAATTPGAPPESSYPAPLAPDTDPEADLALPLTGELTYELMNRDSALALARLAARHGVRAMAYVSAAAGAPVLPARYLSTKREAEGLIARDYAALRGVFVRPPLMYDASRPVTVGVAAMVGAGAALNAVTGGLLKGLLGAAGMSAAKVDTVARATVEALEDESIRGPVEGGLLEELGQRSWRRGML
jgi:uncharacterized protein YbjT (DUF2867 family)